jgi:hypothetical protein
MKRSRNTDTSKANEKRKQQADVFAQEIIRQLDAIERDFGYTFQSLRDRVVALNHVGVKTRRGGKWTKTAMSRVLKRVEVIDRREE